MLKAIQKIPSGMFIIPLLLSVIQYTFWPDLWSNIGGTTAAMFDGSGTGIIVGMLIFGSGTTIQFSKLGAILKHQGTLTLVNLVVSLILAVLFLYFFGLEGIFGISGLAFVATIISVNPAIYSSLLVEYGYNEDSAFYSILGILCLPAIPLIIFSLYISGSVANIDFMPIISTMLPLVLGMILGNIDPAFGEFFGKATGVILFFLGWNLGQGLSLFEAAEAGIPGLIMAVIFIVAMFPLYFLDKKMGYEGISGLAMVTAAGMSTAVPAAVAEAYPEMQPYVGQATAIILVVVLITAFLTPALSKKLANKADSPAGRAETGTTSAE